MYEVRKADSVDQHFSTQVTKNARAHLNTGNQLLASCRMDHVVALTSNDPTSGDEVDMPVPAAAIGDIANDLVPLGIAEDPDHHIITDEMHHPWRDNLKRESPIDQKLQLFSDYGSHAQRIRGLFERHALWLGHSPNAASKQPRCQDAMSLADDIEHAVQRSACGLVAFSGRIAVAVVSHQCSWIPVVAPSTAKDSCAVRRKTPQSGTPFPPHRCAPREGLCANWSCYHPGCARPNVRVVEFVLTLRSMRRMS
jgi:hypothetical protein